MRGSGALAALAGRHGAWIAAVAGAATSLAFAPYALAPLAVLGPALLFLCFEDQTPRRAAWRGFLWGAGLFGAGTWWIYTAIHDYGRAPLWLTILLQAGMISILAAYTALLGWAAARFADAGSRAGRLLLLPAGLVLAEWLRGWVLTGFPWLQSGYAHSDDWLAALAPLGGIHAVSLASALSAGALVALLRGGRGERIAALSLVIAIWGLASLFADRTWTTPAGDGLSVALVQGAIPQDEKWETEHRAATLERYRELNRQALGARIVVWPESALPMLAHEAENYLAAIRAEAAARGSDVLLGLLRFDFGSGEIRNGLYAMSREGEAWYYKRQLVPFGEFFPVPQTVRSWMRLMNLPYYDMTPGSDRQPALRAAGQRLGATICYEDGYGAAQLEVLREATLLINVTNNAWFGDSAAPHQQLQISRFRAREAGRFLMRSTSNGITAVIAPDGTVVARAPQFEPAVLKSTVRPYTGLTPYARVGNWPVLTVCALLCIAAIALSRRSLRA